MGPTGTTRIGPEFQELPRGDLRALAAQDEPQTDEASALSSLAFRLLNTNFGHLWIMMMRMNREVITGGRGRGYSVGPGSRYRERARCGKLKRVTVESREVGRELNYRGG